MNAKDIQFHVETDMVITGYNPEMADMLNPRGEIYGFTSFVVAVAPDGSTKRHAATTNDDEQKATAIALRIANALTARAKKLGRLPVQFERWPAGWPVYGSHAWSAYGEKMQVEHERNEQEREA